MKVRLAPRALADAKRLKRWWVRHRTKAPDLFERELDVTLARIAAMPNLGSLYEPEGGDVGVRRALMKKTGHHIYYAVQGDEIVVITIWGARKERGPKL
jgi:plasmid stabilization system protein ParE